MRAPFAIRKGPRLLVALEHPKRSWAVLIMSRKWGPTCENADLDRRSMVADFGLERISCGISQTLGSCNEPHPEGSVGG